MARKISDEDLVNLVGTIARNSEALNTKHEIVRNLTRTFKVYCYGDKRSTELLNLSISYFGLLETN